MLNELTLIQRGAQQAGIAMAERHPDIKDVRQVPTLLVRFAGDGSVAAIRPVAPELALWTLRDGQHNSFPFVQPKRALFNVALSDERRRIVSDRVGATRRETVVEALTNAELNAVAFADWPGAGLINRVRERRQEVSSLKGTAGDVLLSCMDRFLIATDSSQGGDPQRLLGQVAELLLSNLRQSASSDWLDVAVALLMEGGGAFMFDAVGDGSVLDAAVIGPLSTALRTPGNQNKTAGCCAITGDLAELVESTFPQPNLPLLGQTYLFARNRDTPANGRYGRFSADSMPVGLETVDRLAAAAKALTSDDRRDITWRPIPGESPKQSDLLIAFVDGVPEAPVSNLLAEDDYFEEGEIPEGVNSIAIFEKRASRLTDLVRARIAASINPSVRIAVFRKVDPANRKVVCAGEWSVARLVEAAARWVEGERNTPPVELPVPVKGEREVRRMSPPHVAPLGVIALSRQLYLRGGLRREEIVGITANDALKLFLEPSKSNGPQSHRILRLVISRRSLLVSGTAQALRKGLAHAKEFDRREVLRTISMLGVLLHNLDRDKEQYMSETAFQLGQLLAAADIVHIGYCADVRGGSIPPSLLGNQVFVMAQAAPAKALATLCRRWKPYDGWARKAARDRARADALVASKRREENQRGWDIRAALRHAREMKPLADKIAVGLVTYTAKKVTDEFRAELLLGYIAGLPKVAKHDDDAGDQDASAPS